MELVKANQWAGRARLGGIELSLAGLIWLVAASKKEEQDRRVGGVYARKLKKVAGKERKKEKKKVRGGKRLLRKEEETRQGRGKRRWRGCYGEEEILTTKD